MLQRILFHAVAVAALGAMCMAQTSSSGQASSSGQQERGAYGSHQSYPSSMSGTTGTSSQKGSPDSAFIRKAAQGNLAEVELGNLAQSNGESQPVKQFGSRMVTDHTKANDELKQIARDKGVAVPTTLDAKDKQEMKKLESEHGAAFDKSYTSEMVKNHETDVAEFRREAQQGKDPEVKAWAQKTLPILEDHLAEARQAKSQVAANETGKTTPGAMSAPQNERQK